MIFKQWLIKKLIGKSPNSVITDEMREKALETRRMNHQLGQAEKRQEFQERLKALENINNPKMTTEDKLVTMLLPMLAQKMGQTNPYNQGTFGEQQPMDNSTHNVQLPSVEFSKSQIKSLLELNPNILKHAKQLKDEQIKVYLIQQIPNISSTAIQDIIKEIREVTV